MRRTHQIGMQISIRLLHVITVFADAVAEAADMVVGMITDTMSLANDTLKQLRIFTGIVTDHEEGRLDIIMPERVEDKRCGFRDRTVIEGQIHCLLVPVHSPCRPGIKPAQPHTRLLDNHILFLFLIVLLCYRHAPGRRAGYCSTQAPASYPTPHQPFHPTAGAG